MGLKDSDDHDAASFDDGSKSVSCSICLEVVADNGDRSWAKLQCGHQFHLDCIGSAFNVKGSMQCPNCRKIEKGQWLYANGCRTLPEFSMDDWTHEEDVYDLSYSEMSFGVHWCPFGQLARLPTTFEDAELTPAAYHDPLGQHALFAEHSGVSSAAHPCPYVAYLGPIPPSSSTSNGSIPDASSVSNHWNGPSVQGEVPGSYPFPAIDLHYHNWEHHSVHSPPFSASRSRPGGSDPPSVAHTVQRSARPNNDLPRSGSFLHPFVVGHSSGARAVNSVATSLIPPYPGSNARTRDRVQALQTYYQQQRPSHPVSSRAHIISANRRPLNHRGMTPMATASDQLGGFYFFPAGSSSHSFQEPESLSSTRFHLWERDHLPGFLSHVDRDLAREGLRAAHGGSEAGTRHGSFSQRHGFDRVESNNRT